MTIDQQVIHGDRMIVTVDKVHERAKRRRVTILDQASGSTVTVILSNKGREVQASFNGIVFQIGMPKMRRYAERGFYFAMDVLEDMGWKAPKDRSTE